MQKKCNKTRLLPKMGKEIFSGKCFREFCLFCREYSGNKFLSTLTQTAELPLPSSVNVICNLNEIHRFRLHLNRLEFGLSFSIWSTTSPRTTMSSSPQPSTSASSSGKGTPKKPIYSSLTKHTIPELKKMCADAKLPRTGNKQQLMAILVWGWKPNYETLGKLNIAEMRKMCADVNLPKTGTREQLRARLVEIPTPKGGARKGALEMERVNQLFRDVGISDPRKVNKCLKAGVLKGFVPLTEEGSLDLDHVLLKSGCMCCSKELTCTIRDALYQIEYGGNEYEDGGEHAAIKCTNEEEFDGDGCGGNFITGLCNGQPQFDSGKFHNHCGKCPNFGHCIGDYRSHCSGKGRKSRNGKGRISWRGLFSMF